MRDSIAIPEDEEMNHNDIVGTEMTTGYNTPAATTGRRTFLKAAGVVGGTIVGGLPLALASTPVHALPVGRDKTYTTYNYARSKVYDYGVSSDRLDTSRKVNLDRKKMVASIVHRPGGDPKWRFPYVQTVMGQKFTLSGSGTRDAVITLDGRQGGELYKQGGESGVGNASVSLVPFIIGRTPAGEKSTYYGSGGFLRTLSSSYAQKSMSFDVSDYRGRLSVYEDPSDPDDPLSGLTAGNTYIVGMELKVDTESSPTNGPVQLGSWWRRGGVATPGDNGGVYLDRIKIDFR